MVANKEPIFAEAANLTEVTFVAADGTTPKDVFIAGADGAKVAAILVTSDDTAAVLMKVYIRDGTTNFLIGSKSVPTLSGTNGLAPTINLLDRNLIPGLDLDGAIFIPSGYSIRVGPNAAVTAAKTVTVVGIGIDY